MFITIYSFITAIICFNLFIAVFNILRKKFDVYTGFNLYPLLFVITVTMVRILVPMEFPFTREINVDFILPGIQIFLQAYLFGFVPISYFAFFVAVSSVISTFLLFRFMKFLFKESKRLKKLQPTDNKRLITLMEEVLYKTNVRAAYAIVVFPGIKGPSIYGLRKPVIMLPEIIFELSDNDIQAVLYHEWQHYINKDLWLKTLVTVLCCIMWWNLPVLKLKRNIDKTIELKCDLDVTRNMSVEDTFEYAQSLFRIHNLLCDGEPEEETADSMSIRYEGLSVKSVDDENELHHRFQMMLPFEKRNHKIGIACCTVLTMLFLLSYTFVIQPFIHFPQDGFCENRYVVVEVIGLSDENTHILSHADGTYALYFQGEFDRYIKDEADLENVLRVFGDIPIIPYIHMNNEGS